MLNIINKHGDFCLTFSKIIVLRKNIAGFKKESEAFRYYWMTGKVMGSMGINKLFLSFRYCIIVFPNWEKFYESVKFCKIKYTNKFLKFSQKYSIYFIFVT